MTETNGGRILAIALCCALASLVTVDAGMAQVVNNEMLGSTTNTHTEFGSFK